MNYDAFWRSLHEITIAQAEAALAKARGEK